MQPHPLALDRCRVGRASHADRAIVPALNDSQNTFCTHTHTHTQPPRQRQRMRGGSTEGKRLNTPARPLGVAG